MAPPTDLAPFVRFYSSSSSSSSNPDASPSSLPLRLTRRTASPVRTFCFMSAAASLLNNLFPAVRAACEWLRGPTMALALPPAAPRRRVLTGTFFGHRRGRISFAVQENPRSDPLLLLELATPTSHLVKEMASGMVRILLETDQQSSAAAGAGPDQLSKKKKKSGRGPLWEEPVWNMYCNGQRCGFAVARASTAADVRLLRVVQAVSVGAGVLSAPQPAPALPSTTGGDSACFSRSCSRSGDTADGEVMYMRARFERVVGSKDSEALYMINPDNGAKGSADGTNNIGGPELSIFLLRI